MQKTMERILVTGGCGFVGANLVPRLEKAGYCVRVLDNLTRGQRAFLEHSPAEIHEGDIRDPEAVAAAMEGIDGVVHLAAYGSVVESVHEPESNFDINGYGTLKVLEGARQAGVKRFVFASTGGALIGEAEPPVDEDSVPRPKSPYGASKLVGEGYCHAYAGSYALPTVILRFGNLYGPVSAHKKGAVTVFCKALLRGEPMRIFGDGTASRDFLHVDDLCDGIMAALPADLPPATVLHLAMGREVTIAELADVLRQAAGAPEHPIEYTGIRPGEVHRNFATYDRAAAVLGFQPRVTLEDGMRRTWEWFSTRPEAALAIKTTDS